MWPLVTNSYYFGIVSTVTKELGTAEVRMFLFNTAKVSIIFAAPGF